MLVLTLICLNDHAAGIDQGWANLVELVQGDMAKNELAGFVVDELLLLLSDYHELGFKYYRDEWHKYDAYADETVTLSLMGQAVEGVARGVDDTGALRLAVAGEIKVFSGGEVSLRGTK